MSSPSPTPLRLWERDWFPYAAVALALLLSGVVSLWLMTLVPSGRYTDKPMAEVEIPRLFEEASQFLAENDLRAARERYRRALEYDPNHLIALKEMRALDDRIRYDEKFNDAKMLLQDGAYSDALLAIERVLTDRPDSSEAQELRKQIQQAMVSSAEAGKAATVSEGLAAARAAMERKEWLVAGQHLGEVILADPQNAEAHALLAELTRLSQP